MLEEAVEVMRALWTGNETSFSGEHYEVENARIYSMPAEPPAVHVSGFGPKATDLAARIGDGYVQTSPAKELVERYRKGGGTGPASAGLKVCWGRDRDECARLAHHLWRTSGVPGELSQELRTPAHFDQAAQLVTVESMAEHMPCGPELQPIVDAVREYVDAGFENFFRFYEKELGPALGEL
jgi:G6PDH family F420-dependent oxidoreductase